VINAVWISIFDPVELFRNPVQSGSELQNPVGSPIRKSAEMRTDQDWIGLIRTEANFGRIRAGSDYNFLKIGRSGLDRTEKIFVVLKCLF